MLDSFVGDPKLLHSMGILVSFVVTTLLIGLFKHKLPKDQGRKFAVQGALSEGKARGAGIIIVCVFAFVSALMSGAGTETILYLLFIILSMVTGFMDDASERPWKDYKKALFDLFVSIGISAIFIIENGTEVTLALFNISFTMPVPWFALLSVILIWMSINVVNCTDGVDGLSSSVGIVSLVSFVIIAELKAPDWGFSYVSLNFVACLLAYLLFNTSPSTVLMGDAGSRALGTLLAICALKCHDPLIFLLFAFVFIADGGIGLVKLFLARYLKIRILKNVLTPLHDHVRKNMSWSNPQTVYRFTLMQGVVSVVTLWLASNI